MALASVRFKSEMAFGGAGDPSLVTTETAKRSSNSTVRLWLDGEQVGRAAVANGDCCGRGFPAALPVGVRHVSRHHRQLEQPIKAQSQTRDSGIVENVGAHVPKQIDDKKKATMLKNESPEIILMACYK